MNLLEHEAKTLLKAAGIPTPLSSLLTKDAPSLNQYLPIVLKSQVPIGGRGKAGGIVIVDNSNDLQPTIDNLLKLGIKGFKPTALLAEEKLAIQTELYLSLLVDRATAGILLVANKAGGIEVEDTKDFASWQVDYQKPDFDALGQSLADYYDLQGQTFVLQDLAQKLFTCLKENDATLIEINPLVLTKDDQLIAGDCKLTLDDAAAFRHPEWSFEQKSVEANFVSLNPEGTVATIANGAGLAMATVDAVADAGMKPANFLDIGGGANADSVLAAFRRIMEYPNVQAIVINIFAGITRCDEVAKAIIIARDKMPNLPPLCIRLAGTNYEAAKELLDAHEISLLPTLRECLDTAKQEVEHE